MLPTIPNSHHQITPIPQSSLLPIISFYTNSYIFPNISHNPTYTLKSLWHCVQNCENIVDILFRLQQNLQINFSKLTINPYRLFNIYIIKIRMKIRHLLLLGLLLASTYSETINLIDFIKSSKPASVLPANCVKADDKNNCVLCSDGYEVAKNGGCTKIQTGADDFAPGAGFVPCGKDQSCGEAKNFKTDQEFTDFVNKYSPEVSGGAYPMFKTLDVSFASTASMSVAPAAAAKPLPSVDPGRDFSGTNNQVNGVDEADLLKTDGTYIYTISNQVLSITLAYPVDKARVVSKLNFKDFNPSALFLEGDYMAVFGTQYETVACKNPYPIYYGGPVLTATEPVALAATTAKAAPAIESVSAAKIAPAVDTASISAAKIAAPSLIRPFPYPYYPCTYSIPYTFIKIYDVSNRAKPFLLKEFQVSGSYFDGRKLDNGFMYLITTHDFSYIRFPWYSWGTSRINLSSSSIFWYPGTYSRPSAVNIISFNLGNPISSTKRVATICAQYVNIMYMSERHIYLTHSLWENGQDYTKIHKIYVRGNYIRPFADGKVRGSVNNQFSLDEYKQFFRVATTTNANGATSNNIFVLNYYLNAYGSLTGIAPTERIFSARYVGRRCYLVTFRQVDPFFVISLKDHRKPEILGQLKVPGFSRYLHPYDENTIVGLGRDADASGRQQGLKVGLFDVSDPTNPKEVCDPFIASENYAYSNAEWQHKAFLLSADKNIMVIPGNLNYRDTQFNGAFAFYISSTQITLKSVINHVLSPTDNYWQRNVERSLYIEEYLYTKSQCLLRINEIGADFSFAGVKNINLPCDVKQFDPIFIKPLPIVKPLPIPIPGPILLDTVKASPAA